MRAKCSGHREVLFALLNHFVCCISLVTLLRTYLYTVISYYIVVKIKKNWRFQKLKSIDFAAEVFNIYLVEATFRMKKRLFIKRIIVIGKVIQMNILQSANILKSIIYIEMAKRFNTANPY